MILLLLATRAMVRLLCHFAAIGDLVSLEALLESGADTHTPARGGRTAAHIAAAQGRRPTLERLLTVYGASKTTRDAEGRTCFHDALLSKDVGCIQLTRPTPSIVSRTKRSRGGSVLRQDSVLRRSKCDVT